MRETIEVHYTCGCSATGLAPTRIQAGVPKHCPAHGTAGDDMRVQQSQPDPYGESETGGAADRKADAAPTLESDSTIFYEMQRRPIDFYPAPDSTDEPPATDPANPEGE